MENLEIAERQVWFPKWIEYADSHQMKANRVYLSLGYKEPKARNPIMAPCWRVY